jgi:hypothetical protein
LQELGQYEKNTAKQAFVIIGFDCDQKKSKN